MKKRILEEQEKKRAVSRTALQKKPRNRRMSLAAGASALADFMNKENPDAPTQDSSKPIADLFPATTLVFMDLAGFTSWSSSREPSDVFLLLETLFFEFGKSQW